MKRAIECSFDGLPGPTHHFGGLSPGNLAAQAHAGEISNPRAAALEGLAKMRFVASLGVAQYVLPPHPRPDVATLRRFGFTGTDAEVLARALRDAPGLLNACSSASAMWAANAATVAPSADTEDRRVHLSVANLATMFHRSLEPRTTLAVLRRVFADARTFAVHPALPAHQEVGDEGAANHTRLVTTGTALHLFAWGRAAADRTEGPRRFPARQAREASAAVARLNRLPEASVLLWRQDPEGIDAGAFHADVLAVGAEGFFMLHERAFVETERLLGTLAHRLGDGFTHCLATERELPLADAVAAYPFNSQIVRARSGLVVIAPEEARERRTARDFLERVVAESNPIGAVHYVSVNESMNNGGGPACLRLRVPLTAKERAALGARVALDDALGRALQAWIEAHYRDRLASADLADPALLEETRVALDALTTLLELGSVYDFQQAP